MRILPVMDIMNQQVVRGVAGQRDRYRPIQSPLCASSRPGDVAAALQRQTGDPSLYVADLTALRGGQPEWEQYRELMRRDIDIWLDAGIRNEEQAAALVQLEFNGRRLHQIIVALESLDGPEQLTPIVECVGYERLTFSLDLFHGQPWNAGPGWVDATAETIAATAFAAGLRRMIVLDIASVGMGQGPTTLELCTRLSRRYAGMEIISGGGVRGPNDVRQFCRAGCRRVLVSTALHDGRITKADIMAIAEGVFPGTPRPLP